MKSDDMNRLAAPSHRDLDSCDEVDSASNRRLARFCDATRIVMVGKRKNADAFLCSFAYQGSRA
jgi:hypothetical protein